MITQIRSDIEYLDGPLAGLRIVDGFNVTCGDRAEADRTVAWVHKVRATDDFVRAIGTGHCYRFVGEITRQMEV